MVDGVLTVVALSQERILPRLTAQLLTTLAGSQSRWSSRVFAADAWFRSPTVSVFQLPSRSTSRLTELQRSLRKRWLSLSRTTLTCVLDASFASSTSSAQFIPRLAAMDTLAALTLTSPGNSPRTSSGSKRVCVALVDSKPNGESYD